MLIDEHADSPGQIPPWGEAEFVEAAASDIPPEVDLSDLPR
jgi:hypothetical protein